MSALGSCLGPPKGREGKGGQATALPAAERITPSPALIKAPPLGKIRGGGGRGMSGCCPPTPGSPLMVPVNLGGGLSLRGGSCTTCASPSSSGGLLVMLPAVPTSSPPSLGRRLLGERGGGAPPGDMAPPPPSLREAWEVAVEGGSPGLSLDEEEEEEE